MKPYGIIALLLSLLLPACGKHTFYAQGPAPIPDEPHEISAVICRHADPGVVETVILVTYSDDSINGHVAVGSSDGAHGVIGEWNGLGSVTVSLDGTDYTFQETSAGVDLITGGNTHSFDLANCGHR